MQEHPLLDALNFDVLEANLPGGLEELPAGFNSVLTDDKDGGHTIVALRTDPPAVIVPTPDEGTEDRRALSLLMLGNALHFLATASAEKPLLPIHLSPDGEPVMGALYESDTARALTSPPDMSVLDTRPHSPIGNDRGERDSGLVPWLMALAALALLLERIIGVSWKSPA